MKKILGITIISLFTLGKSTHASEPKEKQKVVVPESDFIYNQINWGKFKKLNKQVFNLGYQGYLNLKAQGQINKSNNLLTICDYSLSSNTPRMWVFDLNSKKVIVHSLVAHGQGTGEEYAKKFSNVHESHQSSLGFFRTEGTYIGSNGYSLKLTGLDRGFNCNAMDRAIVIHGADYVSNEFIKNNQRLGRSWGCPALPQATATNIINLIKGGSCLFLYYPEQQYLTRSKWLRTNMPMLSGPEEKLAEHPRRKLMANSYSFDIVEQRQRFSVPQQGNGSL